MAMTLRAPLRNAGRSRGESLQNPLLGGVDAEQTGRSAAAVGEPYPELTFLSHSGSINLPLRLHRDEYL